MFKSIFAVLIICGFASTQITLEGGTCPNVDVQPNFVPQKYGGRWYEYAKFLTYFERNRRCIYAETTFNSNNTFQRLNTGVNTLTNVRSFTRGNGTVVANAKLKVEFSRRVTQESNLWILGTDYNNYAATYNCRPNLPNDTRNLTAWILTRSPYPTEDIIVKALQVFQAQGVPLQYFEKSDQEGCYN